LLQDWLLVFLQNIVTFMLHAIFNVKIGHHTLSCLLIPSLAFLTTTALTTPRLSNKWNRSLIACWWWGDNVDDVDTLA